MPRWPDRRLTTSVNYYLSSWYKRSEFGIRAAIFFSAATVAGAFGGLLAAGIAQMSGTAGLLGWSWSESTPPDTISPSDD